VSEHILRHLTTADPVLGALIRAVGPLGLEPPGDCEPFWTLTRAIAHQQLNGTAANTILARLVATCGEAGAFPGPARILATSVEKLRAAGFSFAKVAALKDLATKAIAAVVPDRAALNALTDEAIVELLTQVRGVGRWTVEMLLISNLARPDVLPVDDFGVRNGFRAAYGLRKLPHPKALAAWGERWKPFRSAAAWYLWRAVELERAGTLPRPTERIRLPRVVKRRAAGKAHSKRAGGRSGRAARAPAVRRLPERAARPRRASVRPGGASSARLRRSDARTSPRRRRGSPPRAPATRR
jgi:DNA-3-methyladenine glycosylase II